MRARVKNGRWVLDDPTDLPEGTEVEIVTRTVTPSAGASPAVYFDDRLRMYIQALFASTCASKHASVRNHTAKDEEELVERAKSNAIANQRKFTIPEDIKKAAPDVLRRFISAGGGKGNDLSPNDIIRKILDETEVP